jgi:hypothetical protein
VGAGGEGRGSRLRGIVTEPEAKRDEEDVGHNVFPSNGLGIMLGTLMRIVIKGWGRVKHFGC